MASLSIRLDAQTASAVDRITARTGKTKSEIVREAIADYAEKIDTSKGESLYDKMAPDIGIWDSGGMQLSTRTGEKFSEMLLKERDERRRADRRRSTRRVAGSVGPLASPVCCDHRYNFSIYRSAHPYASLSCLR